MKQSHNVDCNQKKEDGNLPFRERHHADLHQNRCMEVLVITRSLGGMPSDMFRTSGASSPIIRAAVIASSHHNSLHTQQNALESG